MKGRQTSKKSPVSRKKKTRRKSRKSMPKTSDLLGASPQSKFLLENLYALSVASKYSEKPKKKMYEKCSKKEDCKGQLVCVSEMCVDPVKKPKIEDLLVYLLK